MTQAIQDYRKFGFVSIPVPVVVPEGEPETLLLNVDESNLPNGVYKWETVALWEQPVNRFLQFRIDVQGVTGTGATLVHSGPTGTNEVASSIGLAVVVDGNLSIQVFALFPEQAGTANGTIEKAIIMFERKLEALP